MCMYYVSQFIWGVASLVKMNIGAPAYLWIIFYILENHATGLFLGPVVHSQKICQM